METHDYEDPVDEMIVKRLARLGNMPIDTTNLDKSICARIPKPASTWHRMLRPLAAVAASFLIVAVIGWALLSNRNVLASPADMAQMHRDMVTGKIATMKVRSMDEANQALMAFSGNFPRLSDPPQAQTMACCMRNVGNKKVACVLLNNGNAPVTMVVANTDVVEVPAVPATMRNGQPYYVQSIDNLHMVMSEREHHWICLIGELPADKLMELSDGLKFSSVP